MGWAVNKEPFMTLDFQQVHEQVTKIGENAQRCADELGAKRESARHLLAMYAQELEALRKKIEAALRHDPSLRCARPVDEALNSHFPLPALPTQVTLLAADGSQITPDRHAPVHYGLINVGAIQMRLGSPESPLLTIRSTLLYDDQLYTPTGTLSDDALALQRDLSERKALAELAGGAPPPVITLTDGPLELWGAKDIGGEDGSEFQKSLQVYQAALRQLHQLGATTGGYVDKPGADLLVRLLELAAVPESEMKGLQTFHPLRGVREEDLYTGWLAADERSAVFAMQSQSAKLYHDELGLHFFYLNVGHPGQTRLARVEIPAWVAEDRGRLNSLHAALIQQCRALGERGYPYLLHRAHETALVKIEEKEQVTQMIIQELMRKGVPVGNLSGKQALKELPGKKRYGL
jgi:hypothetical protein